MEKQMKSTPWFAACILAVTVCPILASGPIGVYALVDKVAFEPNSDKPERIRISGVFITAVETPDNSTVYSAPQRGSLYFALPKGNEELARREWQDLKSVAGSRAIVGFGSSWHPKVRVAKLDEDARIPDDYPMGNGVGRINADQPRAKALLDYKDR
jgi:hypothetical protein